MGTKIHTVNECKVKRVNDDKTKDMAKRSSVYADKFNTVSGSKSSA